MRILAALLPLASCAAIQEQGAQPDPGLWTVGLDGRSFERADLDDSDGDLAVSRFGARIEKKWRLARGSGWKLRLEHEESRYDFGRGDGLVDDLGGFEHARDTTVGASWWMPSEDGPSWFALANLTTGTADGADLDDGFYVKVFGGVQWHVRDSLSLGVGVFGRTELEDDPRVFPIPLIDWRIDAKNQVGIVQSIDPGLGYTRHVDERIDVYVAMQFATRQYRLDSDDRDDAALVDSERGLRVGALYDDGRALKAEVYTGLAERELTLNADDHEVEREDVDPAWTIGFALSYAF